MTSDWKSNFKYADIILDKIAYSLIFIFKTTIFPFSKTSWKPKKLSSSNGGEKVFKISYSPIKLLVMRVISDFIIDKVRGSKFRNSFSKKVMEESKS